MKPLQENIKPHTHKGLVKIKLGHERAGTGKVLSGTIYKIQKL